MKTLITVWCLNALLIATACAAKSPPPPNPERLKRVEVEWINPSDYTDIRPANQSRNRFRETTFKHLEKHLEELAARLPAGQRLKLTVTNLDLAGQVWPGHMMGLGLSSDVRLIKRVDIPRINFSYELLDGSGAMIRTGEEKLKDMSFQDRAAARYRNQTLRYEKTMLRDWFVSNFELAEPQP